MTPTMTPLEKYKKDFFASIVVFLVALPLCLGIALASGFPASTGIISGIIGGIIVGYFAGSPLQVSGPAAGLIMIIWDVTQTFGFEAFGLIVLMAGLIQVLFGVFKLGQIFKAVSPALIQGMLSGIGLSILFSQFHIMFDAAPKKGVIENIIAIPDIVLDGFFRTTDVNHHFAAMIGALTIAIILIWSALPSKFNKIPPALIAVFTAVVVSALFNLHINYIDISGSITEGMTFFSLNSLSFLTDHRIFVAAVSIAFIASAETLLTAAAVDKMTIEDKSLKTDFNKEILAQGIGNTIAGFLGVLPITGVIARSATNVQSGAKTKNAAVMHGIWLLLFITLLPNALGYIPVASLAALLVYVGYKLINPAAAKKIYELSKGEFAIFLITVLGIIMTNLLEGIIIGFVASLLKNAYKAMKSSLHLEKDLQDNRVILHVSGNLNFLQLPKIETLLETIQPGQHVIVKLDGLMNIDHACIEKLISWTEEFEKEGGNVIIDWNSVKNVYPTFGWEKMFPQKELVSAE